MEFLLPLIVFFTVLAMGVLLVRRQNTRSQEDSLLRRIAQPFAEDEQPDDVDITRATMTPERTLVGNLLSRVHVFRRLQESLWQAGIYIPASELLGLMMILGALGVAAGHVWGAGARLPALVSGLVFFLLPLFYIQIRKRRRLRAFDAQLPEILDLLKSSLDAGHTLQRALQVTVEEFPDPASSELRIVLEQNRLGLPLANALAYMLKRLPDENLRFLVVAIRIQSEVGSSLAGIIGQLARTIRDRQRLVLKVRVLTAQPRLSGIFAGLMPIILVLGLHYIDPEHVNMLFHDPVGFKVTKIAAVMEVMAFLWIRYLMRVDY